MELRMLSIKNEKTSLIILFFLLISSSVIKQRYYGIYVKFLSFTRGNDDFIIVHGYDRNISQVCNYYEIKHFVNLSWFFQFICDNCLLFFRIFVFLFALFSLIKKYETFFKK